MLRQGVLKTLSIITLSSLSISAVAGSTANFQNINPSSVHFSILYLKPKSNNFKYAVFVSGMQPLSQSWANQSLNPAYSAAFEFGINYAIPQTLYSLSTDWLHLNTSDSDSKQAATSTELATVQFVAPPYDVGPAVFGVKHGQSNVKFNFNNVDLNVNRVFVVNSGVTAKVFGGIDILNLNQNLTTLFNDYAGTPPTPISYPLPADPAFYFQTQNTSNYLGAGPDLGINVQFINCYGFGVTGQFLGTVTAGTIKVEDQFTSASRRLSLAGITTSQQYITAPNMIQIVPGFDAKLGLLYSKSWKMWNVMVEGGYRIAYYANAISEVSPATLVQAGLSEITPEFATGTMAINTTQTTDRPFGFNGPYLNVSVGLG